VTEIPTPDPLEFRVRRDPAIALGALGFLLAVTVAWWTLALWPMAAETPAWLARTREVCFGATRTGLPSASGWLVLIGEPAAVIGALFVIAGPTLGAGLTGLWGGPGGRIGLVLLSGGLLAGLGAVVGRIAGTEAPALSGANWHAVEGPPPPLGLVSQSGVRWSLDDLHGRPAIVIFAYAHCVTVCPTLIHDLRRARNGSLDPALVVVSLDPWRDTPARLPHIAQTWGLGPGDVVLSGAVDEVTRVVNAWGVPWRRDSLTGEIGHGTTVFVVEANRGRTFEVPGGAAETAVQLARAGGAE
jgi:cytochrome oxidase Cu insertion factor (SCO1/SenC/PrrC family)